MRYSIEPRDRIYVKGYGFLSFAKNMCKNVSNKYGQKLLDNAKKSTADAIKTASKRVIQKTTEATGDLIGNKISDKIASTSKKSSNEIQHNETESKAKGKGKPKNVPKKDIYLQRKDNKLLMN